MTDKQPSRFQQGHAKVGGRQKGTPNKVTASIREHAQDYSLEALDNIVAIMRDDTAPHQTRLAAAKEILDRGHGKPSQAVDLNTGMRHEEWLDLLYATDEAA